MVMLTILYRNKIVIFDTPLWNESSLQLVKRREIPFDQTPQVISILSTGELMTGNSQVKNRKYILANNWHILGVHCLWTKSSST